MTGPLAPDVPESFNATALLVDRHLAEGQGARTLFGYRGQRPTFPTRPATSTGTIERFRRRAGEIPSTRS